MAMRMRMMITTAATNIRMRARKNNILSSYFVICLDESRRGETEGPSSLSSSSPSHSSPRDPLSEGCSSAGTADNVVSSPSTVSSSVESSGESSARLPSAESSARLPLGKKNVHPEKYGF